MRDSIHIGRGSAAMREPNFDDLFVSTKRTRKTRDTRTASAGLLQRMGGVRRIADILAGLVVVAAILLVFVNALGLQRAPHQSPVPKPAISDAALKRTTASIPAPAAAPVPQARREPVKRTPADLMLDIQRELASKGYYDGAVDGLPGPRVNQAIRSFEQMQGLKVTGEPSEAMLEKIRRAAAKSDITGSISPATPVTTGSRIVSVQRALARYGYGPVRLNGELDKDTLAAVERFERDRNLSPSGEISDRLVRELANYSGSLLD